MRIMPKNTRNMVTTFLPGKLPAKQQKNYLIGAACREINGF